MSKALTGGILLGVAGGLLAAATGGLGAGIEGVLMGSSMFAAHGVALMATLALSGASMEAGAIAEALSSNRGSNITLRQPAAYRQIILGTQRVGGNIVYASTTGDKHDHYHRVIVLAGHVCHSILNLYLDGRKVHWGGRGDGYAAALEAPTPEEFITLVSVHWSTAPNRANQVLSIYHAHQDILNPQQEAA